MHLSQISIFTVTVLACSGLTSISAASPNQSIPTEEFTSVSPIPVPLSQTQTVQQNPQQNLQSFNGRGFEVAQAAIENPAPANNPVSSALLIHLDVPSGFTLSPVPTSEHFTAETRVAQTIPGSVASPLSTPVMLTQVPTPDASTTTGDTFSSPEAREAKESLLIDPLVLPPAEGRRAAPGSTFGVPSAYGASWRNVFVGGGLIGPGGFVDASGNDQDLDPDGSIGFGAGFGDAVDTVGFEVDVAIISLRNDFADSGSIGFKFHKVFPQLGNLAVATGWSNPIDWGDSEDAPETVYGVLTKAFELRPGADNPLPLTVTTGVGTGAFRSVGAINADENPPNFFGSLGLRVIPQMSVISTWTGSQLNLGVSAAPFRQVPFTITLGAGDITNNRDNGVRFLMTGGFGFTF